MSSATDVAKAAAGMVLTEPGLSGIVFAVRERRIAFRRLLTYTLNMMVKKTEIVLLLAIGLGVAGHPIMTPVLMVLMLVTNDFLSMSPASRAGQRAPRVPREDSRTPRSIRSSLPGAHAYRHSRERARRVGRDTALPEPLRWPRPP